MGTPRPRPRLCRHFLRDSSVWGRPAIARCLQHPWAPPVIIDARGAAHHLPDSQQDPWVLGRSRLASLWCGLTGVFAGSTKQPCDCHHVAFLQW